jgi:hypothetical protein
MDKFAKDIQEKMEQFKNYQNHISDKEVDIINLQSFEEGGKSDLNKKLEILTKYNLTVEQLDFSIDELTLEDLELKLKEFTAKQESASINPEEPKEPTPKDFSISHSVLISEISKILESMTVIKTNRWGETWQAPQYYYMDIKDNYVIIVTNAWDTYYGVPYVINGDAITMDFNAKVEFIPDWRAKQDGETTNFSIINEVHEAEIAKAFEKFETLQTEKVKIEKQLTESNEKFSSIQTEIDSLKEFKASKLAKERKEAEDALFAQYEALKGVEEFETLKEQASKFASVEDLEKEIALIYVRKNAKFSVSNKKDTLTVNIKVNKIDEEEAPYGGIFEKYNKV